MKQKFQRSQVLLLVFSGVVLLLALISGCYSYWFYHRPRPEAIHAAVFEGITYIREIRRDPRPLVVHVMKIAIDAPGIGFLVTPGEPTQGRQLRARTTSQFLEEFQVQTAMNAGFSYPWYACGPLWYYPHTGDPVNVYGLTFSRGQQYAWPEQGYSTIYFSQDNRVSIDEPIAPVYHALSGMAVFLKDGRCNPNLPALMHPYEPSPRTAIALDRSKRKLLIFVVDGRQPNYSEGASLLELADIAVQYGAYTALNLDGGGSSTLVIEGSDGRPQLLNSPIHGRIPPGRERPVANHLGIFARRLSVE